MKKIIAALLLIFSFSNRNDYYKLSIDDYSVVVGYDDGDYLDVAYKYSINSEIKENETIENVSIYLFDELLGTGSFSNNKNKSISYKDAKLSKLSVYVKDLENRKFKIDDIELDNSVKSNCTKLNGTYIEKNGCACVIEKQIRDELNVVELHGDYLNIDRDELDHIEIYIK